MAQIDSTEIQKKKLLFGRYQLISILGDGAVGAVYRVYDQERDMELALKVLTSEIDYDVHTVARFKEEYSILKRITHPNLVKAYDLLEQEGQVAYSMEFVRGADLCTLLNANKINTDLSVKVILDTLSALDVLHSFGILHRDLKLENIIVDNSGVVKLCDLGLVKSVFKKSMTKTGVLLGTAHYMAPEYITEGEYTEQSDIYAVGVLFFELLSKRRRLSHLQGNDVVRFLLKTKFKVPVEELDEEERFKKIIFKATQYNQKLRYKSAGSFISDLQGISEDFEEVVPKVVENRRFTEFKRVENISKNNSHFFITLSYLLAFCIVVFSGIASYDSLNRSETISYGGNINLYGSGKIIKANLTNNMLESEWKSCKKGIIDFELATLKCGKSSFILVNLDKADDYVTFTITNKENKLNHIVNLVRN